MPVFIVKVLPYLLLTELFGFSPPVPQSETHEEKGDTLLQEQRDMMRERKTRQIETYEDNL